MTGFSDAAQGEGRACQRQLAAVHVPHAWFRVWERQKSCTVGQSGGCGTVESGEFRDFDSFLCTRSHFCGLIGLKLYCIN